MSWRRALPLIAVCVAVAWAGRGALDGPQAGRGGAFAPGASMHGLVTRISDGDTIHVSVGGRDEKVRYIGIDTPETHKPNTPVQCFGRRASAFNARLVGRRDVDLRLDAETRDRYGRLLAYVYRRPDGLFVNAELVRQGYARTLTIPPNVRFADRFASLAREARGAGHGLWAACP